MSGTHGELFSEIGKIVIAAHAGQTIDLKAKSEDLASRYWNLGVPAEVLAKAIARSLGAIAVSMAVVSHRNGSANGNGHSHIAPLVAGDDSEPIQVNGAAHDAGEPSADVIESPAKTAAALFPSGVRLAVLS
jgi:hypothetical protein